MKLYSDSSSGMSPASHGGDAIPPLPEGAEELLRDVAYRAGELLLRYRGNIRTIEYKGALNLVTEADRASEALIVSRIREAFPGHAILAEEGGAHDSAGARVSSLWRWVIDPLDGTTNFAHALPIFSVSMALQHDNTSAAGCVFAPVLDEFYFARAGAGATLNGSPIRVSATASLQQSLVVTGFPYDRAQRIEHYMEVFGKILARTQGVLRWGSAAIDLCHVACGRLEAFWEEYLSPWDTAAGELIVREAGGRVTRFDGSPFSVFDKEIVATNGAVHDALVDILGPYSVDDSSRRRKT